MQVSSPSTNHRVRQFTPGCIRARINRSVFICTSNLYLYINLMISISLIYQFAKCFRPFYPLSDEQQDQQCDHIREHLDDL